MEHKRNLGDKFSPFKTIDHHCSKSLRLKAVTKALCGHPGISPEVLQKIRKQQAMGVYQAQRALRALRSALYNIPTPPTLILNEQLKKKASKFVLDCAATPVPFTMMPNGAWFLCMAINRVIGRLRVELVVPELTCRGESRTVVITKHVCKQIAERAGIRGSVSAFVANSILTKPVIVRNTKSDAHCLIIQGQHSEVLGYCPIEPVICSLDPLDHGRRFGREVFDERPRWRLKTFLKNDRRSIKNFQPC